MDPRLASLLDRLQTTRFADLSGSEAYTVIRVGERLLNESAAAFVATSTVVRDLKVHPRASNQIDVQVKLAKPAFLPAFNVTLHIDRQPQLPDQPELVLRLSGAGGLLRLAGPAIESSGALPPGISLAGDRVLVDVRRVLQSRGRGDLLEYIEQLQVLSEDGRLVLAVQLRVR
jgi:hypothetical protein